MAFSYAIPDLHGRADLLRDALGAIAARSGGAALTLVLLGDYVDKGPGSRQVIEALMALQAAPPPGWLVICLKGNHDLMMCNAVRDPATRDDWLGKGGEPALASYGTTSAQDVAAIPETHVAWLENLALMHADRHRVFVHAGVDPAVPLEQQSERTLLWKRYPAGFTEGFGERHVVHGHDRSRDGPLRFAGRTNLDTMAWSTGRLVVGVFDDDLPGGPVDLIEVKGPAAADLSTAQPAP